MRDSYQIPKAFLDIVTESLSIRRRFGAIVATLSLFVRNREIKPSIKTKEEIAEGFSAIQAIRGLCGIGVKCAQNIGCTCLTWEQPQCKV